MNSSDRKIARALNALVDAVNSTGGVVKDQKGYMVPNADHDWVDLGEAYMLACDALGVKPCRGDKEESRDQS